MLNNNYNNLNSISNNIYIALFWVLKALYIEGGGESPHPPPVCSIHLDDATAAILRQNAQHTPAYRWRGDSDEVNQCMGMIRRPWWSEANGEIWPGCRGYTLLFFEGHPGIFNDYRESGPRFNVSSEGRCLSLTLCASGQEIVLDLEQTNHWR